MSTPLSISEESSPDNSLPAVPLVPLLPDCPKPDALPKFRNSFRWRQAPRVLDKGRPRFGEITSREARLMEGVEESDMLSELPSDIRSRQGEIVSEPAFSGSSSMSNNSSTSRASDCMKRSSLPVLPTSPRGERGDRTAYRRMRFYRKPSEGAASFTQAASSIIGGVAGSSASSSDHQPKFDHQFKEVTQNDPVVERLESKVVVGGPSALLKTLRSRRGSSSCDTADGQQASASPPESPRNFKQRKRTSFDTMYMRRRVSLLKSNLNQTGGWGSPSSPGLEDDFVPRARRTTTTSTNQSMSPSSSRTPTYTSEKTPTFTSEKTPTYTSERSTDCVLNREHESFRDSDPQREQRVITLESIGSSLSQESSKARADTQYACGSKGEEIQTSKCGPMDRTLTLREFPSLPFSDEEQWSYAPITKKKKRISSRRSSSVPAEVVEEFQGLHADPMQEKRVCKRSEPRLSSKYTEKNEKESRIDGSTLDTMPPGGSDFTISRTSSQREHGSFYRSDWGRITDRGTEWSTDGSSGSHLVRNTSGSCRHDHPAPRCADDSEPLDVFSCEEFTDSPRSNPRSSAKLYFKPQFF